MSSEPRERPLAIGCMRLSTSPERDEERAVATLHAALDAGVTLLDTADAYAFDDGDGGHNERLIARALATWSGDATRVRVATKGGMTRPGGRWVVDGRARHLTAACATSRRALGVEAIDLYQLHAPDPRTPLATSVRALAGLQRDGAVREIGLCNVTLVQLEEALRIAPIAAVQVEASPWRDEVLRSGLVERCAAEGILLLAYRPFGGAKASGRVAREPTLAGVAERHGVTPWEVVLAWLRDLAPAIVPLPGPTRGETARSAARAAAVRLGAADREELDAAFPAGRLLREPRRRPAVTGAATTAGAVVGAASEVVLVIGLPGAGKSTLAAELVARGYQRLNRDDRGGRLADLLPDLAARLAAGGRVVLDNTYATRAARSRVLEVAARQGVPVRCLWLDTSLEQAQQNVVRRMLARHGRLLAPPEIAAAARDDPGIFGPDVLFRYRRSFEPPALDEGFAAIERVPFAPRRDPASAEGRALVVWYEGILRRSQAGARAPSTPDDVAVFAGRGAVLARCRAEGWRLAGLTWHPELAAGAATPATLEATFARTHELLGVELEPLWCPHADGPPRCWCRKPLPGLLVAFLARHGLDPASCVYVGRDGADRNFAKHLGMAYREAAELFTE